MPFIEYQYNLCGTKQGKNLKMKMCVAYKGNMYVAKRKQKISYLKC